MNKLHLERIIKEKGFTTKTLVEKLGITENGFAYMLKNDTIKVATIEKIADILNVSVCVFFECNNQAEKSKPEKIMEMVIKEDSKSIDELLLKKTLYHDNTDFETVLDDLIIISQSIAKYAGLEDDELSLLTEKGILTENYFVLFDIFNEKNKALGKIRENLKRN